MADSIIRLRIDSQEYDAKLKRAGDALSRYFDTVKQGGGTLEHLDDGVLDAVKAFGKMGTAANSVRGSLGEMTKAFTELSVRYKHLTDEEKNAPFGVEMAKSLEQLKTRIADTKNHLSNVNRELGNTSNVSGGAKDSLQQLAEMFGVNVTRLTAVGAALGATTAAMNVAKDAFMASEEKVDEWGRTMESARSLYDGFLNALNTGDISGFLSRIDSIVDAARKAYDEMDRLGTQKTLNKGPLSELQAEQKRFQAMLRTGRYIAPTADTGLAPSTATGTILSKNQLADIDQKLKSNTMSIAKIMESEIDQASAAIDAMYNKFAKTLGMTIEEFRAGTSSIEELERRIKAEQKRQEKLYDGAFVDQQTGRLVTKRDTNAGKGWSTFRVDGEEFKYLSEQIEKRNAYRGTVYDMYGSAYKTINRVEGIGSPKIGGGKGSTSGAPTYAADSIAAQEKLVADLTKKWKEATEAEREYYNNLRGIEQAKLDVMLGKGLDVSRLAEIKEVPVNFTPFKLEMPDKIDMGLMTPLRALEDQLKRLQEEQEKFGGISSEMWQKYQKEIDDTNRQIDIFKGKHLENGAKASAESFTTAASAIGSVGNALSQIQDPSAKILGIVAEAIATVAQAYASTLASDKTTKSNIWAFIGAAAAATASMVTTISSIHSATGYADGGIVQGHTYSGDQIPAMLNAGELILNKAQQGNLASQISGGLGNLKMTAKVRGTDMILTIDNTNKSAGKGKMLTTKFG